MAIFEQLLDGLKDPNPMMRVWALRVLGMVEEGRALHAILDIYQHDPDTRVREVAQWAGKLIWEAEQRRAIDGAALPSPKVVEDAAYKEARLIESMLVKPGLHDDKTRMTQQLLQTEWQRLDLIAASNPRATQTQTMAAFAPLDDKHLDLLDLGLSEEFLRRAAENLGEGQ